MVFAFVENTRHGFSVLQGMDTGIAAPRVIGAPRDTTSLRLKISNPTCTQGRLCSQPWAVIRNPFGIQGNQSQRDCVSKPGVGLSHEGLPRVRNRSEYSTPTELCPMRRRLRILRMGIAPNHDPPGLGYLRVVKGRGAGRLLSDRGNDLVESPARAQRGFGLGFVGREVAANVDGFALHG